MNNVLAFVNTNRCNIEEAAKQESTQQFAIVVVLIILSTTGYLVFKSYGSTDGSGKAIWTLAGGILLAIVIYYIIGIFFAPWCQ